MAASAANVPGARSERIAPGDSVDLDEYNRRWLQIWDAGLEPGKRFDAGAASPLLQHLLRSRALGVAGRRVLVPGCGRGYDAVAAAEAGAALAVGIDLSDAAVAAAAAHRDAALAAAPDVARRVEFAAADFFEYAHPSGGAFDVGYDYTFLCALPPGETRERWARAWARHLAPGGELVTLIFPVDPDADPNVGPPFPVTPELYEALLLGAGFQRLELAPVPHALSHSARAGREWLGRWRAPGDGDGSGSCGGGGGGGGSAAASKF